MKPCPAIGVSLLLWLGAPSFLLQKPLFLQHFGALGASRRDGLALFRENRLLVETVCLCWTLWPKGGPQMPPRCRQVAPRCPRCCSDDPQMLRDAPQMPPDVPQMSLRCPQLLAGGPQMPSRCPQMPLRCPSDAPRCFSDAPRCRDAPSQMLPDAPKWPPDASVEEYLRYI